MQEDPALARCSPACAPDPRAASFRWDSAGTDTKEQMFCRRGREERALLSLASKDAEEGPCPRGARGAAGPREHAQAHERHALTCEAGCRGSSLPRVSGGKMRRRTVKRSEASSASRRCAGHDLAV